VRSNVIFLPLPLKPHHFENDLQVYDPAELDSHYSADFLERMAEFEQEIAAIVARTKQERIIKMYAVRSVRGPTSFHQNSLNSASELWCIRPAMPA